MSLRKKISNEKKKNPKYINDKIPFDDFNKIKEKDKIPINERLNILETRVNYIYKALSHANVIKAVPIVTLVYDDFEQCRKRNLAIYNNWTNYFTQLSKYNANLKFIDIFNFIDKFIFDGFFQKNIKRNVKVYSLEDKENAEKVNHILLKDRHPHSYELKQPENKEYVSYDINDNDINLYFFPKEFIDNINNNNNQNNNNIFDNNNFNNIQLLKPPLIPSVTSNDNVVNKLDTSVINVNIKNDQFVCSDRRFVVLGAQRPLFNTTVDMTTVNHFNNASSYGAGGPGIVNISLIIFHCMLHLKCEFDDDKKDHKNHTDEFLNEFINFLPSALFGHPLLPKVTMIPT